MEFSVRLAPSRSQQQQQQLPEDPLQPLRAMADRVGKEVEEFAVRLDNWYDQSKKGAAEKYEATVKVIGEFSDIAERNANHLKQQDPTLTNGQLSEHKKKEIRRVAHSGDTKDEPLWFGQSTRASVPSSSAQELRDWQAERATWELVRVVFGLYRQKPESKPKADPKADKRAKLAQAGGLDPLGPKEQVWERFILNDDLAKEKQAVLKWLQQTAKNTENNVDRILDQWAKESGKDINTWTSGWLETKASIKQTKRAQGIEGPLDPTTTVHGRDAEGPLVTRLDPDAQTRQKGALEKRDVYYEHALWMVAYEMLRRGEPMNQINEWFKHKNQGYRAFMLGASGEERPEGCPNLATPDFGYLHRRTTYLAAQGSSYPYEAAALGIVSGNFQTIQSISSSWDDHLFSYYNAFLLARFDQFLLTEPKERPRAQTRKPFNFPGILEHFDGDWTNATKKTIDLLLQDKATSEQAKTPMKLIQGALLTQSLDKLVHKVGIAIADATQEKSSRSTFIVDPDHTAEAAVAAGPDGTFSSRGKRSIVIDEYYRAFLHDPHALRILVHVFILLGNSRSPLQPSRRNALFARGNVIAAYVEYLRYAQRLQPIPLYTAQMEKWRGSMTLARVLPHITDREEQKECVNHMMRYNIDTESTLIRYFDYIVGQTGLVTGITHEIQNPITKYELRDKCVQGPTMYLWPNGQRVRARANKTISEKDRAVVESLGWLNYLEEKDEEKFARNIEKALAIFLLTGHISAAAHLIEALNVENELSQFVRLLSLFEQYRAEETSVIGQTAPSKILKNTIADLRATFYSIVDFNFNPKQTAWWKIYKIYVPEFVLAYLSVLQAASWILKPDYFTEAMDLAVALTEKEWLNKTFQETGRVRELVQRLADVSASSLLSAKQDKKEAKVSKLGHTRAIWDPNRQ